MNQKKEPPSLHFTNNPNVKEKFILLSLLLTIFTTFVAEEWLLLDLPSVIGLFSVMFTTLTLISIKYANSLKTKLALELSK